MKRYLALAAVAVVLLGVLTGCGKDEKSVSGTKGGSGKTATITFSGHGDQSEIAVFRDLVKKFNDGQSEVKVNYTPVPADYVGKTGTALMGGAGADVFYVPDDMFGEWVSKNFIYNMQPLLDKSSINLGDIWESAINRYRYNGKTTWDGDIYCLPKDMGPTVLYYNKDMFKAKNVELPPKDRPMTWEELLDKAQKLTGDGVFGIGPIWHEAFVWSNGGDFLSEDRKTFTLNEPKAVEGLQFVADLTNKYHVCPDARTRQSMSDSQLFLSQRLGMVFGLRAMTPTYREAPFDWDVCYIPSGAENVISGWSGTVGLAINQKCKNPEAAFKFIEFLAGEEGQKAQTELGFSLPIYKSMANTDVFLQPGQKPESAEVFIKSAEKQLATPNTWLPNKKWWDDLNNQLSDVWDGSMSAADAMNAIKDTIEKDIREGNPQLFE